MMGGGGIGSGETPEWRRTFFFLFFFSRGGKMMESGENRKKVKSNCLNARRLLPMDGNFLNAGSRSDEAESLTLTDEFFLTRARATPMRLGERAKDQKTWTADTGCCQEVNERPSDRHKD